MMRSRLFESQSRRTQIQANWSPPQLRVVGYHSAWPGVPQIYKSPSLVYGRQRHITLVNRSGARTHDLRIASIHPTFKPHCGQTSQATSSPVPAPLMHTGVSWCRRVHPDSSPLNAALSLRSHNLSRPRVHSRDAATSRSTHGMAGTRNRSSRTVSRCGSSSRVAVGFSYRPTAPSAAACSDPCAAACIPHEFALPTRLQGIRSAPSSLSSRLSKASTSARS